MPLYSVAAFLLYIFKSSVLLFFCLSQFTGNAQENSSDTLRELTLEEVVVKAFEQNKNIRNIPAAVSVIGNKELQRFNSLSIVNAVNTTPGVRMEERSPGSYRFNIRGSSLRSPFGVRNVKVYYNDLPFTDPGGHTYLNGLGYYNLKNIEVIKGPGSSLYGAGTGGVMLIQSLDTSLNQGMFFEGSLSSFDTKNIYGSFETGKEKGIQKIGFQYQKSDGYRDHSALERSVFEWTGNHLLSGNRFLQTTFLFNHLYYQTPGALTFAEYKKNRRMARPSAGIFPGAEQAKAAIYQTTFLAGATYQHHITSNFYNKTSLYGSFTQLKNPAIRNYGRNNEPHVGGRIIFKWSQNVKESIFAIDFGAEMQQGFANFSVHSNDNGEEGDLQTYDEVLNNQAFVFSQASLGTNNWIFSASASINQFAVNFKRFHPNLFKQKRKFKNEIAPRISLLKKFKDFSIYSSIAKGFSPPTITELIPTGSALNFNLNAEEGTNYDLGIRGLLFQKLNVDINAFVFNLRNTIVQRRDAGGGDFFINAGKTAQKGIETSLTLPLFLSSTFVTQSNVWFNHMYHYFKYKNFRQLDNDFSGNGIPGVAPHTISTGFEFVLSNKLSGNINYYFSDRIPLNDANDAYADSYHLIGAKLGYNLNFISKTKLAISAGVENLLNENYSLGNDINAFGGRYYNAAAKRNFFVSISLQMNK